MKPEKFTTEDTEKKNYRFFKNSVNSVVASSSKDYPLKDVTKRIISCAMEVHSTLGPGLLESVYEEALAQKLTIRGIAYEKQKEIALKYILIENDVIVELKAVETMVKIYGSSWM